MRLWRLLRKHNQITSTVINEPLIICHQFLIIGPQVHKPLGGGGVGASKRVAAMCNASIIYMADDAVHVY
jgi:hypothetical protein